MRIDGKKRNSDMVVGVERELDLSSAQTIEYILILKLVFYVEISNKESYIFEIS